MPQFVKHRAQPVFVRHNVGQHADVALAIHVRAERVRTFARLFVEIAASDHVVNRQADAGVVILADFEDVHIRIDRVEVGAKDGGRLLEERVVIMPGPQFIHGDAAVLGEFGVNLRLGTAERFARELVEPIEQSQHLLLRLLVEIKLQHVIVPESKLARRLIAQPDQLLQVPIDHAAHPLAGFPHCFSLRRILRFLQNLATLAVRHFFVIHLRSEDVEGLLDRIGFGGNLL